MGSYLRKAAEALPNPGTTGNWDRRFVEGVVNAGEFNGATVGALSGRGSWLQQLYLALDPRPTFAGANWIQRLCGGGGRELVGVITVGGQDVEPLIFLDFKNGVYTADGDAVTVGDLLTSDANYGNWNPADIQAGTGLVGGSVSSENSAPIFAGDALTLIASGSTTLTRISATGVNKNFRYELIDNLNDYNTYYYSQMSFDEGGPNSNAIGDQVNPDVTEAILADGVHQGALTFIDGKISRSIDGAAIITINPAAAWTPPILVMGMVVPTGMVVESIGIYPAQADAELPGLSAL